MNYCYWYVAALGLTACALHIVFSVGFALVSTYVIKHSLAYQPYICQSTCFAHLDFNVNADCVCSAENCAKAWSGSSLAGDTWKVSLDHVIILCICAHANCVRALYVLWWIETELCLLNAPYQYELVLSVLYSLNTEQVFLLECNNEVNSLHIKNLGVLILSCH